MNRSRGNTSVAIRLLILLVATAMVGIGLQTWLSLRTAQQRSQQATTNGLLALYENYSDEIALLEEASATLSISFANRPDIQELYLARDREGLLQLLTPVFQTLAEEYNIVHLYIEEPNGTVFVRVHNPASYGDDITYRRTAAAALATQTTVAGVEIGPSRLGIRSVSPLFHAQEGGESEFTGMVEVGLDYDQPFIDDLKARNNADYRMWVTYEAAAPAGLTPAEDAPESPSTELFYYAGTYLSALPISEESYLQVVETGAPIIQFVSDGEQELAVLLAPLMAYGERPIGVIEIAVSREETLAALNQIQMRTLGLAGMLVVMAVLVLGGAVNQIILRPLNHLAQVSRSYLDGDLQARVELPPGDEFGNLGNTINTLTIQLDETVRGLENTIAERTRDLERRSAQLEASIEVVRASTSVLDTDKLIQQTVELIRERFGLYYVGLFLADESHKWAVLRAATGAGGQALLARSHRLEIGSGSMIGWAIENRQARIAQEAGEDAVRLATPELPETRSEAALPLHSRGEVLGALSVQSTEPGAFDEETIAVLQTMADQVAIAIDNARLFAQSQDALETARRAYGEITRRAWNRLLQTRSDWGYVYGREATAPTEGNWRPEMLQAARRGQRVLSNGTGEASLAIPIRVRDQVIGVLGFRKQTGVWTSEEINLLDTLTDQLSVALESARAYQDTQMRAAREQVTSEVTARMRETLDLDAVLQTAAQEIRQALGLHSVTIQLGDSTEVVEAPQDEEAHQ